MNIEEFRNYCLSKNGVEEGFPFDQSTLVFKVEGKMFALTSLEMFKSVNLKCDPAKALELREAHSSIRPGFHMNKKHWNTIDLYGDVDDQMLCELIDHSYHMVVMGLPKKIRMKYITSS